MPDQVSEVFHSTDTSQGPEDQPRRSQRVFRLSLRPNGSKLFRKVLRRQEAVLLGDPRVPRTLTVVKDFIALPECCSVPSTSTS